MSNLQRDARQIAREKALFRYTNALERGDFDTVAAVLREAENDAVLERMILEVNAALASEMPAALHVLSINGRHSHTQPSFDKGEEPMTAIRMPSTARGQSQPRIQDRRLPLIAALLALILFGAIALFASQFGPNEPPNNFAALQPLNSATPTRLSSRTPTPAPSSTFAPSRTIAPSKTPEATLTFTPAPIMTATLMSQIGIMPVDVSTGVIVSADTVNLRSGPGLDYPIITTLMPGTSVIVREQGDERGWYPDWYEVQAQDGAVGWVAAVNVSVTMMLEPTVVPPDSGGWLGAPNTSYLDYSCQIVGESAGPNGIAVYDAPQSDSYVIGFLPPGGYYSIFAQVGDWWEVFVLPVGTPADGQRPGRLAWVMSANLQNTNVSACQNIPLPTATISPSMIPGAAVDIIAGQTTLPTVSATPLVFVGTPGGFESATPIFTPTFVPMEGSADTLVMTIMPTALPPAVVPPAFPESTATPVPNIIPLGVADGPASLDGFEYGGQVINDIRSQRTIDAMRQAEMTWMKVALNHTTGLSPEVTFSAIQEAHNNGFRILLTITGDTQSATNSSYQQEYADFLGEVAIFGPDAIEVWNEPNLDRSWTRGEISGQSYTNLLIASYEAIKEANPHVLVVSAAPAPTGAGDAFPEQVMNDDQFLREMVEAGALDYVDCVGMHYNEGIISPTQSEGDSRDDSYTRYFSRMIGMYREIVGGDVPLCFTELGFISGEGYSPLPMAFAWASDTTQAQQAQWLGEAVALAAENGNVRLLIVYNVDSVEYDANPQAGYAILRPDGNCYACLSLAAAQ